MARPARIMRIPGPGVTRAISPSRISAEPNEMLITFQISPTFLRGGRSCRLAGGGAAAGASVTA